MVWLIIFTHILCYVLGNTACFLAFNLYDPPLKRLIIAFIIGGVVITSITLLLLNARHVYIELTALSLKPN